MFVTRLVGIDFCMNLGLWGPSVVARQVSLAIRQLRYQSSSTGVSPPRAVLPRFNLPWTGQAPEIVGLLVVTQESTDVGVSCR